MADADTKDKRRTARKVAADSMRGAVVAEWRAKRDWYEEQRGKGIETPSETQVPTLELSQAIYRESLLLVLEMVRSAPSDRDRLRAAKLVFDLRLGEARLMAEMSGKLAAPAQPVDREHRHVLKPEQAEEILAQRRHFLAKVANEGTD